MRAALLLALGALLALARPAAAKMCGLADYACTGKK